MTIEYQHRCHRLARAILLNRAGLLDRDPSEIKIPLADADSLSDAIEAAVDKWFSDANG